MDLFKKAKSLMTQEKLNTTRTENYSEKEAAIASTMTRA